MASQSAAPTGDNNIIVQAAGDNINIQIGHRAWLELIPVSRRLQSNPRLDIDILDPTFQAVPLVGRESDLATLSTWLTSEPKIAIAALFGAGGSGKTRLALELLQNHLPSGWQGGILTAGEGKRFVHKENLSTWSWQKPTLIVADYAALFAETLATWFRELADHAPPAHPLRILLLERHADPETGWFASLTDTSRQGRRTRRDLFHPPDPIRIAPLKEFDQRRSVLKSGMAAAAALKPGGPVGVPDLPAPGTDPLFDHRLADPQWNAPLLLLMAAVIAASSGLPQALSFSRPDLAKELAKRERTRLENSVENPTAKTLLVHLCACITLCGGLTKADALNVAEQEFAALKMRYPGDAGQAVRDLAKLLGKFDPIPPVTPDLLAEAFLLEAFGEDGIAAVSRLAPVASQRVAAVLIRAVQDFSPSGEARPLQWLEALVSQGSQDSSVRQVIKEALPLTSVALLSLSTTVTKSLLEQAKIDEPKYSTESSRNNLAGLWNDLSVRLGGMGQRPEALAAIQEAVTIRRALAQANPDAFLPDLAMSLNNLSNRQSAMGQRAEALAAIQEAVTHYRSLAQANPDAFLPALALSLNNLSNSHSDMGQRAEALAAIQEAVTILRALAQTNPDAFLPALALSLNNLSNRQSDMGQRADALASIQEAVTIRRALAQANPDAFLPDLGRSLSVYGDRLSETGQLPGACDAARESLEILAPFVHRFPNVFDNLARATVKDYVTRSNQLNQEPDPNLLAHFIHLSKEQGPQDD